MRLTLLTFWRLLWRNRENAGIHLLIPGTRTPSNLSTCSLSSSVLSWCHSSVWTTPIPFASKKEVVQVVFSLAFKTTETWPSLLCHHYSSLCPVKSKLWVSLLRVRPFPNLGFWRRPFFNSCFPPFLPNQLFPALNISFNNSMNLPSASILLSLPPHSTLAGTCCFSQTTRNWKKGSNSYSFILLYHTKPPWSGAKISNHQTSIFNQHSKKFKMFNT